MIRLVTLMLLAAAVYLGSYLVLRTVQSERWERDGGTYVIFPQDMPALYYLFRPLSHLDAAVTGRGAHIGPHREAAG